MPRYNYGGQAVIEGVMMRGRHTAAVALYRSSGSMLVHEERLDPHLYGSKVSQWPLVRGLLLLFDMLILGTRMMRFAANIYVQSELHRREGLEVPVAGEGITSDAARMPVVEATPAQMADIGGAGLALTIVFSLAVAIGLFFLLPLGVVGLLQRSIAPMGWWSLVVEGLLRLALLIGYLAAIGRIASVQRVFEYHGAEHKTINAYEAGDRLEVQAVRRASRVHTRCGTGFLLIVVVLSILVFALLGHPPLPWLVLSRVLLVPVIAALAYELMRLGAAHYSNPVVRWLMAPSLALQGLTTREPDERQIECAIVALERVLKSDSVLAENQVA
jgi:uncharacterized protein YqhQ